MAAVDGGLKTRARSAAWFLKFVTIIDKFPYEIEES